MDALVYAGECPRCGTAMPLIRRADGEVLCAVYGHHSRPAAPVIDTAPLVQQLPLELTFESASVGRRRNPDAPAAALVNDVHAATGRPGPAPGNVVRLHGRARGVTQGRRVG